MTWHRYMDDFFVIWDGPLFLLEEFFSKLNENTYNLSFTYTHHTAEVSFLDNLVKIDEHGNISTSLF